MITDIEDFFAKGCGRCDRFETPTCVARVWSEGLDALRRVCLDVGLAETVKWGHPCYMHAGRNIALIGALRSDFRLNFFKSALMTDPEGVLERQGPNTRNPDTIRFAGAADVVRLEPVLRAYLREAMGYAEQGLVPQQAPAEIVLPDELVDALDADPELAEAFRDLTPGRQRSYVIHLSSAKTSATRLARIERCRGKIIAGKGFNER